MASQTEIFVKALSRYVQTPNIRGDPVDLTDNQWLQPSRMDIVCSSRNLGFVSLTDSSSMLCWSASFYPQPIHNYRRRSTAGLAIDFPTINVLGFICYTIYTSSFLYSPLIRKQYAARHPLSETPSVRFNDFAFALHAVVLSIIVYSQFWPRIWGFKVSRFQRASRPILGLFWGSLVAIALVVCIVLGKSPDGGYDALSWAWIDVVSTFWSKLLSAADM